MCRRAGLFDTPERFVEIVSEDLAHLANTGRTPIRGDTRCIVLGYLTCMAIWALRNEWGRSRPTAEKISAFRDRMTGPRDPDRLAVRSITLGSENRCRPHRTLLAQALLTTIPSISTLAPFGSEATPTAARAG